MHQGIYIAGQKLEVVLAKPQTERKSDGPYSYNAGYATNHLQHPGYGVGAGYGVSSGFQQVL